ncbi:FAD-dependent monooxygenase [Nocardia sp. XZ_19_231]|uniref:FAD-dependent monooxygenase n=1 Tax=Nocardia sp. XZ_19_231 TaxID=2769252 RepID=UPI00188E222B|nr:FAD-dependent monooxygenase [Nocardia sp. XZ_19_231]
MTQSDNVTVLIVGAGGCGLSTSIFLSNLGVDHLLIEQRGETSRLPKAHYLSQRTMELYRQHGVADAITAVGAPLDKFGKVVWQTSLTGRGPYDGKVLYELDAFGAGSLSERYAGDSPVDSTNLPQIRLEPILRDLAEQRAPGRVRYGCELLDWVDEGSTIVARLRDADGAESTVRAKYLIAADGGRTVGPRLKVKMEGWPKFHQVTTAHFSADLSRWQHDGALITFFINPEQAELSGAMLVQMGPTWGKFSEEWGLHFTADADDPARTRKDALLQRIRDVLKAPDLPITLHKVSSWTVDAVLAAKYRVGNVFLAGDAAHRMPPAAGLGLNTAIQDGHNLAWKIAAVESGRSEATLLDSYESERRPIGRDNLDWALGILKNTELITENALGFGPQVPRLVRPAFFHVYFEDSRRGATTRARAGEVFRTHRVDCQAHDMELGLAYAEGALTPDGTTAPPREPMGDIYHPTTRPGHRLPHAWVEKDGTRLSTLDLVPRDRPVLLVGPAGQPWLDAARELSADPAVPFVVATIGDDHSAATYRENGAWSRVREIADDGAILVRPDHHVCWRSLSTNDNPADALRAAFANIGASGWR